MGYPMAAFPFLEVPLPLSNYVVPSAEVRLTGTETFKVRALTVPDITFLVQHNMEDLIAIVTKYQETRGDLADKARMADLLFMVARDFPSIAVEMISICVIGEPVTDEIRSKVSMLPAPIQMEAMTHIAKMTVEASGNLGNLIADLRQRLQSAAGELGPKAQPQSA